MEVELSRSEMMVAGLVGLLRQTESMGKGWKDNVVKSDPFQVHNVGAQGELALAKALNIYWGAGLNTFHANDVGQYQVRTATLKPDSLYPPDLPIRPKDKPDDIFILVVASPPRFSCVGWCYGREGPELGKKMNPNGGSPAWFVPQGKLKPLEELPV